MSIRGCIVAVFIALVLIVAWKIYWWPKTLARSVSPDGRYVCEVVDRPRLFGDVDVVGTLSTNSWWPTEITGEEALDWGSIRHYDDYRITWDVIDGRATEANIKCLGDKSTSQPDRTVRLVVKD